MTAPTKSDRPCSSSGTLFDYDSRKQEIADIEKIMTGPNFWDDQEHSQTVVPRLKAVKALVKPMDEIVSILDELDVMFELGEDD
ncbi:MAG: peptide chain release factor 2, partial [Thermoguttaceae bacterium]|nr:peptide chain release factor 2 [Thermoguttaceae bacterium]